VSTRSGDGVADLPDVNVLVALYVTSHPHHDAARAWFDRANSIATTPITQAGLLCMLMNPVIVDRPRRASAIAAVTDLINTPGVTYWPDLTANVAQSRFMYALTGHRQVTDLHLLDIAAAHGGRLVTFDAKLRAALRKADRWWVMTLD
jgi:toxin-antitoxin system PIN domain toxin